ncbi:hypothetical protein [Streptomyces cyaneofuscatus]|uniref:hypothetical protein n=1 Tax=Streptomyces cyaneofuscatus TaxID=66883 RepID=UPI003684C66A
MQARVPKDRSECDEPGAGIRADGNPGFELFRGGEGRAVEDDLVARCSGQPEENPLADRLCALRIDVGEAEGIDELETEAIVRQRFEVDGEPGEAAHAARPGVADVDVAAGFGGESHAASIESGARPSQRGSGVMGP